MTHSGQAEGLLNCVYVCVHTPCKRLKRSTCSWWVGEGGGGGGVGEGGDCNKGTGSKVTQTDRYILKRKQRT